MHRQTTHGPTDAPKKRARMGRGQCALAGKSWPRPEGASDSQYGSGTGPESSEALAESPFRRFQVFVDSSWKTSTFDLKVLRTQGLVGGGFPSDHVGRRHGLCRLGQQKTTTIPLTTKHDFLMFSLQFAEAPLAPEGGFR